MHSDAVWGESPKYENLYVQFSQERFHCGNAQRPYRRRLLLRNELAFADQRHAASRYVTDACNNVKRGKIIWNM